MNHRPENDSELTEDVIRIESMAGKLDKLLRERQFGSAQDAFAIIELAAGDARRRLRKVCASR